MKRRSMIFFFFLKEEWDPRPYSFVQHFTLTKHKQTTLELIYRHRTHSSAVDTCPNQHQPEGLKLAGWESTYPNSDVQQSVTNQQWKLNRPKSGALPVETKLLLINLVWKHTLVKKTFCLKSTATPYSWSGTGGKGAWLPTSYPHPTPLQKKTTKTIKH